MSAIEVKKSCIEFRRYDPYHGLAWRWEFADELVSSGQLVRGCEDLALDEAIRFRRMVDRNRAEYRFRQMPVMSKAHQLYTVDGTTTWHLRARLLTNQTIDEIATATGLQPEVVDRFEQVFFDLRTDGKVVAFDWIMDEVFREARNYRTPPVAVVWQYMSLAAGPVMLDVLVADRPRGLESCHPERSRIVALAYLATQWHFTPTWDHAAWREILAKTRELMPLESLPVETEEERRLLASQFEVLEMSHGILKKRRRKPSAPATKPPGSPFQEMMEAVMHTPEWWEART